MAKFRHTTPEMSAEDRLRSWRAGKCPYCGYTQIRRTEVTRGTGVRGIHYVCLNDAPGRKRCAAENFFSNRSLLNLVGEIPA